MFIKEVIDAIKIAILKGPRIFNIKNIRNISKFIQALILIYY